MNKFEGITKKTVFYMLSSVTFFKVLTNAVEKNKKKMVLNSYLAFSIVSQVKIFIP